MKEFGSDFSVDRLMETDYGIWFDNLNSNYYADGRHALYSLLKWKVAQGEWKRLWMPAYFCYEVIHTIQQTGIDIQFYPDSPLTNDCLLIGMLPFQEKDVLFRINYFGLREYRDNTTIPIPVIEDHSHDLLSNWAMRSNADWCIASLRKTLPIPEGGILWSPKQNRLPEAIKSSVENDLIAYKRLSAMLMKSLYLSGKIHTKKIFRSLFIESENALADLSPSGISEITFHLLRSINIQELYSKKKENWDYLFNHLSRELNILCLEKETQGTPLSLILSFKNEIDRNNFREQLIQCNIYPAILWDIPATQDIQIHNLGKCLLSIPCDARYSIDDMNELLGRILK